MIDIYDIQDILECIEIFAKRMICVFENWNCSFSGNIIKIRNDKENLVFILLIIIDSWVYMKDEKILRDEDIVLEDFFFKCVRQFDLRLARELLKCGLEVAAFERGKWHVKVLNDKTLTFQLFACLVKCFKKIDMREWIIVVLRASLIVIVLIWGMWSSRNDEIEIFKIFYIIELVRVLRYSFEENRETFHYHEINQGESDARSKNRIELRKLWEEWVEERISCLTIEWQIVDWVTTCEGWGLR